MANIEGMANKFIVMKNDDVIKYLPDEALNKLHMIQDIIEFNRSLEGKSSNTYLVINTDEDYADQVIDIMKKNGHWG